MLVRNPYYPEQVTRYRLDPQVVDLLSFCTKNPAPMIERLHEIKDFRQFWFVTITPYGKKEEPGVPDKANVMDTFTRLSKIVGPDCVGWRYDPIFITDKYTVDFHIEKFAGMAERLKGYTGQVVISFIDLYKKTLRNFPQARDLTKAEKDILGEAFCDIAKQNKMVLRTCMEGNDWEKFGADVSGCMTRKVLEEALGEEINVPSNVKGTRSGCDCLLGNDIGTYNTCGHGCVYCYANYDMKTVRANMQKHDSNSPFLIGGSMPGDKVRDAKQESWISGQMRWWR